MKVEIRGPNGLLGTVELVDGVAVADEGAQKYLALDRVIVRPGQPRIRVRAADGEEYLKALEHNLRGSYVSERPRRIID